MKINVKMLLLLTIFICSYCTGSAYASNVIGLDLSFDPAPPFSPGEEIVVTASVHPSQPGAYVQIQSEIGGYFASGYTDSNGKFTGVYTVPDDALELVQYTSQSGSICFTAICPESEDQGWAQSLDYYCNIVPKEPLNVIGLDLSFDPAPPFSPGEKIAMTASVYPSQPGAYVQIQSEYAPGYDGGYFASGYTDSNGEFMGVYTVPDDAFEWASQFASGKPGSICFTAICPESENQGWVQSNDYYCNIVPEPELPPFPGYINPPKDLDQDVLCEDINGNGILDFDDVVAYYDNMEWIEEKVPLEFFDYNNNGLIDFDDVVKLYDML